jgi:hypothetical protein
VGVLLPTTPLPAILTGLHAHGNGIASRWEGCRPRIMDGRKPPASVLFEIEFPGAVFV